jgi:acyl-coenzyme A thioesterase PaaI-like protein
VRLENQVKMNSPPTTFLEAAQIEQVSSHEYKANVHPDFSFGPGAHGGFMVALCWRAIGEHFRTTLASYAQPDTVALHSEFLRPGVLGDAKVVVKDVRLGKGSSTVGFALVQGGKEKVLGYAT